MYNMVLCLVVGLSIMLGGRVSQTMHRITRLHDWRPSKWENQYTWVEFSSNSVSPDLVYDYVETTNWALFPNRVATGCIQLVTSTLSQASCSLPQYCKNTTYIVLENGWFSKVGVCIGFSSSIMRHQIVTATGSKYVVNMGTGWCRIGVIQYRNNYPPVTQEMQDNYRYLKCEDGYYYTNVAQICLGAIYNQSSGETYTPHLQATEDGRYCVFNYRNTMKATRYMGPYATTDEMMSVVPYFHTTAGRFNASYKRMMYDEHWALSRNIEGTAELFEETDFSGAQCEAYAQTTNVLPLHYGAITHTIAHAISTALTTIFHMWLDYHAWLWPWLLSFVPAYVYTYLFWVTIVLWYSCLQFTNMYQICAINIAFIVFLSYLRM